MRQRTQKTDGQQSLGSQRTGLYPLVVCMLLLLLFTGLAQPSAVANRRDQPRGAEAGTPTPVALPQVLFDGTNRSLCQRDPGWLTVQGTLRLPQSVRQAMLQTNWYVVYPNDRRTQPVYRLHGLAQDGARFSLQVYWPGIRPDERLVEIHIGAMLLDPLTLNPIMPRGASLDYYWYPWVCPAPTAVPSPSATPTISPTLAPPTPIRTPTPAATNTPTATPTVTNTPTATPSPLAGARLLLSPERAGPNVVNTAQILVATLLSADGLPLKAYPITFRVSGANTYQDTVRTNSNGEAQFTYQGTQRGIDTVEASVSADGLQVTSNTAYVAWITPIQQISTMPVFARFFYSYDYGSFTTGPGQIPAFTQYFPTINFNPPAGTIPGGYSSVNSRPMANITTDLQGNYTGVILAQGNGLQAGVGPLYNFNAVFTGEFVVAAAGNVSFYIYSDDGFILGVGNGAKRVSGAALNPPAGYVTPFERLPWMGDYNWDSSPQGNIVTVYFPEPGRYPYEIDYSECCQGELALTIAVITNGVLHGVPPAGSLILAPRGGEKLFTGSPYTFTVTATDASGIPQANLPIAINITGGNPQQQLVTTNDQGTATFTYVGARSGRDIIQAAAQINGAITYSDQASLLWIARR